MSTRDTHQSSTGNGRKDETRIWILASGPSFLWKDFPCPIFLFNYHYPQFKNRLNGNEYLDMTENRFYYLHPPPTQHFYLFHSTLPPCSPLIYSSIRARLDLLYRLGYSKSQGQCLEEVFQVSWFAFWNQLIHLSFPHHTYSNQVW